MDNYGARYLFIMEFHNKLWSSIIKSYGAPLLKIIMELNN